MDYTRYNTLFTLSDKKTKEDLAEEIAEIILDEYEKVIIERCVRSAYPFLDDYEQKEIATITCDVAKNEICDEFPCYKNRKEFVKDKVREYLEEIDEIIPCGFADFRLRELYDYAGIMVDKGAKLYFDQREYEEFIRLLGLFVTAREPKEEVIHLLFDDGIKLVNKRKRDVTKKYEREFLHTADKKGATGEDLAISAIIAAAPERLIIHKPPKASLLAKNLENIFSDRCSICKGCSICKNVEI